MYLNACLSYLNGWNLLTNQFESEYSDLQRAFEDIRLLSSDPKKSLRTQIRDNLQKNFGELGWETNIGLKLESGKRTRFTIDYLKNRVGGKLILEKQAFVLSSLYANFPLAIKVYDLQLAFILVPMRNLKDRLSAAYFEFTKTLLMDLPYSSTRKPFVIIGFSDDQLETFEVTELNSKIDNFMIDKIGYTFDEMVLLGEKPNYEFKSELPNNQTIAKEVCALANLNDGGVIVFGVTDNGTTLGIPKRTLDEVKQRITNIVRSNCDPIPEFFHEAFDVPHDPNSAVLVTHVNELPRKPCTVQGRVYIRSGPSVQPADSEEIRKMVLG